MLYDFASFAYERFFTDFCHFMPHHFILLWKRANLNKIRVASKMYVVRTDL